MGQHIFYHNITQQKFNLDLESLCDCIKVTQDVIKVSIAGNALVEDLNKEQKQEVLNYLKENS